MKIGKTYVAKPSRIKPTPDRNKISVDIKS